MQPNWKAEQSRLRLSRHSMLSTRDWRKPTDIACTILGALFALAMFIAACLMWDRDHFSKHYAGYFGAQAGGLCQSGCLVFANPADFDSRSCVSACPGGFQNVRGVCLPQNSSRRQQYMLNGQISSLVVGSRFLNFLLNSILITIGVGLLRVVVVNLAPRLSARIDFYLSILLLIAVGVLLLVIFDRFWNQVTPLKLTVAIFCFLIAVAITIMICMYGNQIRLQGIFIEYAVLSLRKHISLYLYVPLFMLLSVGLVSLIVWQHCCFVSKMGSTSVKFVDFNSSGVLGVLNILEFIWGLQFLRDAFNFCIAGKMTDFYWHRDSDNCTSSLICLIKYHWGSIVFGSFLNAFFLIPTMVVDAFRCHPKTLCSKAGQNCNCPCYGYLFDRVRTDAYSYTALTGLPYCESAQECRRICQKSEMMVGVHSPIRNYRFTAHVICTAMAFILCWLVLRESVQYYGIWEYSILIIVLLLVLTWFISVFSDAAEALQTCFLVQRQLEPGYDSMRGLLPEFKDDLEHRERKISKDGNC